MQVAGMPGIMEFIVLFQALSGMNGGQMPIGMPPLPEKAIVSRVAPEECLFYMSMSGTALPDASSANKTEQLLAEPEVQELLKSIDGVVQAFLIRNVADPDEAKNAIHAYSIGKALLTHPWCLFVSEVEVVPGGGSNVKAGMLLYLGEDASAFQADLDAIVAQAKSGDITTVTISGREFHRAKEKNGQALTWGFHKNIFVAGVGEGVVEAMPDRIKTPAPAWLVKMKEQVPVARRSMVTYANLEKAREVFFAAMAAESPTDVEKAKKIFAALGLDKLKAFKAISGMDEIGMVEKTLLESDGSLSGPLAAFCSQQLSVDDLKSVPAGAVQATAMKINAVEVYRAIRDAANVIEAGMGVEIDQKGGATVKMAGFESVEQALATLGETWTISSLPTSEMTPYAGMVVSVEVKDSFANVRTTVEGMLRMIASQDESAPKIDVTQIQGTDVTTLQIPKAPPFLTPCWCIKEGRLIVAASKGAMEAALVPGSADTLADDSAVKKAFAGPVAPTFLIYSNTPASMQTVYPKLPMLLQMVSSASGIGLNQLKLPELSTILPYAEPTVRTIRKSDSGVFLEQRSTMPGIGSSATAPIVVALVLPAVQAAREAARRAASLNNMKQLALCMHNYHEANKAFPPAYTTDASGKPLLSWRVYMLPYLEENELFKEFHLDEPWDSPHNKALIPRMPAAFRSPSYAGEPGKTNYLTVRTPDSAFPGKEKIGFRDIKDGTANTILTVEVNNESAVIWTKPDDYVPDASEPLKGLKGLRPGIFNAGMCDGAVRSISDEIDKTQFKAMVTRAGGEPVTALSP